MKKEIKIFILIVILVFSIKPFSAFADLTVSNGYATNITDTSAVLSGSYSINNSSNETDSWFNVRDLGTGEGFNKMFEEQRPSSGSPYTPTVDILQPSHTYVFSFCVYRGVTTTCSTDWTPFTTLPPPTAPTITASIVSTEIQSKSALLRGIVSSNRRASTTWFEYGDSEDILQNSTYHRTHGPLESGVNLQETIRGLLPAHLYYFRLVGNNGVGGDTNSDTRHNVYTPIQSFTTSSISMIGSGPTNQVPDYSDAALFISTKGTSNISSTSALISGSAIPSAENDTKTYFRYSPIPIPPVFCNDIYGSNMKSTYEDNLGIGGGEQVFSKLITDLEPDTTYYYCAIASTKKNIAYGDSETAFSFTTLPCDTCDPTSIKTKPATEIDVNSATLNAFYNSTKPIKVWFQYFYSLNGKSILKKTSVKSISAGSGPVSIKISSLQNGKTYKYWAVAKRSDGPEVRGSVLSFNAAPATMTGPCNPNGKTNTTIVPEINNPISFSTVSTGNGQSILPTDWQTGLGPAGIPYVGNSPASNQKSYTNTNQGLSLIDISKAKKDYLNQLIGGSSITTPASIYTPPLIGPSYSEIDLPPTLLSTPLISSSSLVTMPTNPCDPTVINNQQNQNENEVISTVDNQTPLKLGQKVTPPVDATVHYHEGVETVFARQIITNSDIAKKYGYDEGTNLQAFAWNLADLLGRKFGYVNSAGKEIRVSKPDIAAYELRLVTGDLTVYEYYNKKIVHIQKLSSTLRGKYNYEYYYNKK